jgi:hypothetical protein
MIELAQAPRLETEKIAIFVPARNIETWIHYLNGNDCNEKESYNSMIKFFFLSFLCAEKSY